MGNPRAAILDNYLPELKMPGLKRTYQSLARETLNSGKHPPGVLAACLAAETKSLREHSLQALLHSARFPMMKTLDVFDFSQIPSLSRPKVLNLATGEFIRAKENVICLGGSGTGKTHIAIAVGLAAIAAGYRVRFIQAITLTQELLQAQQEYRLPKYLKSWQAIDLVIIDELGYLGLGPGGPLLFQFYADRYGYGSLLITSNLEFSRWAEVFGDATLTGALLDRLTHYSTILLFDGEFYRFRESQHRHM